MPLQRAGCYVAFSRLLVQGATRPCYLTALYCLTLSTNELTLPSTRPTNPVVGLFIMALLCFFKIESVPWNLLIPAAHAWMLYA